MNKSMSNQQINHIVVQSGMKCLQYRQLSSRLLDLLTNRLQSIEREHRRSTNPGRAAIRALADQRYVSHIDEIVEVKSIALESHIMWETHKMLVDARKSMASISFKHVNHRN